MSPRPPNAAAPSSILDALNHHADAARESLAFNVEGRALTFGEVRDGARRAATALLGAGIQRGDHLGLLLPTCIEFPLLLFGAQWIGAAPVALDPKLPAMAALRRSRIAGCRTVIAGDDEIGALRQANEIASAPPERSRGRPSDESPVLISVSELSIDRAAPVAEPPRADPDAAAYLQITSGTTGEPRAAIVSHRALIAGLELMRRQRNPQPDEIFAGWVPLHHDLGLVTFVFFSLYLGRPSHLIQPSIPGLRRWLETISRERATMSAAPDFAYRIAARTVPPGAVELSSLRISTNGGEPVRASTIETFENRFNISRVIRPAYGLAEATLNVSMLPPGEAMRVDSAGSVSCGPPGEGLEVRTVDDEGRATPAGEPGRIIVRGASLFSGYWNDPESTAAALRNGWLHTGDVGALDADGHLYIRGRERALIKRAGAMVAPREVEEIVDATPGVRFSAAVGLPPAEGEAEDVVVVAEVREDAATDEGALAAIARDAADRVAAALGFAPGRVLLVRPRSIPRTGSGKIRYNELRRIIAEGELNRFDALLF
jgi:acyl-CoA synthetase (AMP-forming)/AMP-acid ligase II